MIVGLIHQVTQMVTAAVASTGRPVLTLFGIQAVVGATARMGFVEIYPYMEPAISFLAIAVMGVFALAEGFVQHQSEFSEALEDTYVQRIGAGASATSATLLLGSVGQPGTMPPGELGEVLDLANGSGAGPVTTFAAIVGALAISLGLGWVRARVLEVVHDADLDGLYHWAETGGVVTVLLILPFLPLLAFGLVVAVSLGLTAVAIVARTGAWALDKQARRPCPHCDAEVRVEATVCPECTQAVPLVKSLATGRNVAPTPAAAPV